MKLFQSILLSLFFYCFYSFAHADIRIGTVLFYPPFIVSPNQGFDADLSNALCERLQVHCALIPMEFNELFTALNTGKIDLAIGGIIISNERRAHYIFSMPYIISKGDFLILNNSSVKSVSDLAGDRVGVLRGEQDGGVFYNYLETRYGKKLEIMQFDDMEDMITALTDHDITAAFTHESTALYWEQNGGGQFRILGEPMPVGNGIAIMALPENIELLQKINVQLKNMEDKSYLNLYNTYFTQEP